MKPVGSFVDSLIAYIEGPCGKAGFGKRVRGVAEASLIEFERGNFGGRIPAEFREYLSRMGENSWYYKLIDDDIGYFDAVRNWYREPPPPGEYFPTGDSIIIAVGIDIQYALDGSHPPRRPVVVHGSGDPDVKQIGDSFESFCFWRAWYDFRYTPLGNEGGVSLPDATDDHVAKIEASARARGFALQDFSDSSHKMFEGNGHAILLIPHFGIWSLGVRGQGREASQRVAESLARDAQAPFTSCS